MFDKNWEEFIYKNNKHINNYPYDWVISSTNKHVKKKRVALELGSGTSNNLIFLSKFGFKKIYGLEGSKTAIEISKKKISKNKKILIKKTDFNYFNFKKNNYDLILDRTSLTHNKMIDIKRTLKKIHYSLTDEGIFISTFFNKKANFNTTKKDSYKFKFITPNKTGLLTNFFSKNEIKKLFKNFEILELKEVVTTNHLPFKKTYSSWNIVCKK